MQTPSRYARDPRRFRPLARPGVSRCGALVLELVVVLPILLILLLGVVQFGVFFANMQQVALASRVGALEASQTAALPTTDGVAVPQNVVEAIDRQLQTSGIAVCRVRLEHNVGGSRVALIWPASGVCECEPNDHLADPPPGDFVRLSICVELAELMPNCLGRLGVDLCSPSKVAHSTSVFRYELTP